MKYPTKLKPVHNDKATHASCLPLLRHTLFMLKGAASRRMRADRSPSNWRSIQMNISVYTVCGQAKPHHKRPATAVNKNNDSAEITSKAVR